MSKVSKNEQLIHALLDGELDDARAQKVRKMLSTDQQLASFYDDCVAQRESLAALPRFTLSEDFSGRVLQMAQTRHPFRTLMVNRANRFRLRQVVPD